MERPLILVTNDDGINAPGIRTLISIMKDIGDIVVVAPDSPQSGMGHAITINSTLHSSRITPKDSEITEYSCSGTPADCVKLAINELMPRKPDLCVSGINHGSNSSINVIYSGTMSAAVEGAIAGIPSIGFSLLDYSNEADFRASKIVVEKIVNKVLKEGLQKGTCLNVNIPKCSYSDINGYKICRQANARWIEDFDVRNDSKGKTYYCLSGNFQNFDNRKDTDEWALSNRYVSIVPVQFDLTSFDSLTKLKSWNL